MYVTMFGVVISSKDLKYFSRIKFELGASAAELHSFSAEELGFIPHKLAESNRYMVFHKYCFVF